jgi:hypothetical protein
VVLWTWALLLGIPLQAVQGRQEDMPSSGCNVCAFSGDCSHAFQGTSGQFCGTFRSRSHTSDTPCCCPAESSCRLSDDECQCHTNYDDDNNDKQYNQNIRVRLSRRLHRNFTSNNTNHDDHTQMHVGLLGLLVFACVLWCCIKCCCACCCGPKPVENVKYVVLHAQEQYPAQIQVHSSVPIPASPPQEQDPLMIPPAVNPNYLATATAIPIPYDATVLPEAHLASVVPLPADNKHLSRFTDNP